MGSGYNSHHLRFHSLASLVILLNTMAAPLDERTSLGKGPLLTAMVKMPAATPALTPKGAFSTTIAWLG